MSYSEVSFHAAAGTTSINVQGQGTAADRRSWPSTRHPTTIGSAADRAAGPSDSILDANPNATRQAASPRSSATPAALALVLMTAPKSGTEQVSAYSYDFVPEAAVYTGSSFANSRWSPRLRARRSRRDDRRERMPLHV